MMIYYVIVILFVFLFYVTYKAENFEKRGRKNVGIVVVFFLYISYNYFIKGIGETMSNTQNFQGIQRLLSHVRRAVDTYDMIQEGDKIAVGVSGGKDSLALLTALSQLRSFYPQKFEIMGITIDMGFENTDFSPIENFCRQQGIVYKQVKTKIAEIIFDVRKESNPCSLCARMRRGVLHDTVVECGFNKLALGHHYDDVVETFMLNLFYEGRLGAFSPVTYLSRKGIFMIRPLVFASEKEISAFWKKNDLPVVKSNCPADGKTKREEMKQLLSDLDYKSRGIRTRIFGALQRSGIDGWHPNLESDERTNS